MDHLEKIREWIDKNSDQIKCEASENKCANITIENIIYTIVPRNKSGLYSPVLCKRYIENPRTAIKLGLPCLAQTVIYSQDYLIVMSQKMHHPGDILNLETGDRTPTAERIKNIPEFHGEVTINLLSIIRSLHDKGYYHGDPSYSNVFVTNAHNQLMLADFKFLDNLPEDEYKQCIKIAEDIRTAIDSIIWYFERHFPQTDDDKINVLTEIKSDIVDLLYPDDDIITYYTDQNPEKTMKELTQIINSIDEYIFTEGNTFVEEKMDKNIQNYSANTFLYSQAEQPQYKRRKLSSNERHEPQP